MLFTCNDQDYYVYEKLSRREARQLSRRTHEYSKSELYMRGAGAMLALGLIIAARYVYPWLPGAVLVLGLLPVAWYFVRLWRAMQNRLFESRRQRQRDILSQKAASESQISYQLLLGDHTSFLGELIAQKLGLESLSSQREQLIAQYFQRHRIGDEIEFYLAKYDGLGHLCGDTISQMATDACSIVFMHPKGQWDDVKYAEMVKVDRRKYIQSLAGQVEQLRQEKDAAEIRLEGARFTLSEQQRLLSGEGVNR